MMMVYINFKIIIQILLPRTRDVGTFKEDDHIKRLESDLSDLNFFDIREMVERKRNIIFVKNFHFFAQEFSHE
jgi:hypothetical protein